MGKENVTPGPPVSALTPTPEQPDAGKQTIHKHACDSAKTEVSNDANGENNMLANAAAADKLDGYLETIRGPHSVATKPQTPVE